MEKKNFFLLQNVMTIKKAKIATNEMKATQSSHLIFLPLSVRLFEMVDKTTEIITRNVAKK